MYIPAPLRLYSLKRKKGYHVKEKREKKSTSITWNLEKN